MPNSYDIDGVIIIDNYVGLTPQEEDVIITGRSLEEADYTLRALRQRDIYNRVHFNEIPFKEKTRESSGIHKGNTLKDLLSKGHEIQLHFEDDEIQAEIIESICPEVKVIRIVHDLVEKENVWRG